MSSAFRFGVVATPYPGGAQWRALAAKVADLGYGSLLMPDGTQLLSPLPSLAFAAAATDLRVGTFVLASPLRPPRSAAWEAHSLTVLTEGRFELGIGTGLPRAQQAAADFGLAGRSTRQRLEDVEQTIDALRELDGEAHTPVLVAAGGPRSRDLAARKADIVTLAAAPLAPREETEEMAADLWRRAGDRADRLELAVNLFAAGEDIGGEALSFVGVDAAALVANDSIAVLPGNVRQMSDELLRRRDEFGLNYICVGAAFCEQLAPVVERLTGS